MGLATPPWQPWVLLGVWGCVLQHPENFAPDDARAPEDTTPRTERAPDRAPPTDPALPPGDGAAGTDLALEPPPEIVIFTDSLVEVPLDTAPPEDRAPPPPDTLAPPETPPLPGPQYRVAVEDLAILPMHGGSGGGDFAMGCPGGQVAVGISGRSFMLLDGLALRCAFLNPDGSLGPARTVPGVGGPGGTPFQDDCPPGGAVVELHGRAGGEIEALGIGCAPLREWAAGGAPVTRIQAHGAMRPPNFTDPCPRGYVLTGLVGRSGGRVDALQGRCSRIARRVL